MPSLKALEEFKTKFSQVSREDSSNLATNTPYDDLPLPDHEPSPLPEIAKPDDLSDGDEAGYSDNGFEDDGFGADTAALLSNDDSSPLDDLFDMGDLVGDFDLSSDNGAADSGTIETQNGTIDDIDLNDFSGFSVAETEAPEEDSFSAALPDLEDFGITTDEITELMPDQTADSGLGDLDFGNLTDFADAGSEILPDFDESGSASDSGLPAEDIQIEDSSIAEDDFDGLSTENFTDFADFGDIPSTSDNSLDTLGDEPAYVSNEELLADLMNDQPAGDEAGDLDLGDLADFSDAGGDFSTDDFGDLGSDTDFGTGDFDDLQDDQEAFEVPDGTFGSDDLSSDISSGDDTFDSFNLDKDVSPSEFDMNVDSDLVEKELDKDLADLGDFNIPGFDDLNAETPGKQAAKPASFQQPVDGDSDVEEIRLNDREFKRLEDTILSYPLNLRIACAQIIAEEAVPPELMSSFVKLLTRGASAREASALAGKILSKTISIPKGYEKKTGEAFEEEQNSFGYIFVHKFLPVFRLYLAIALVALSLGYLAWSYIYIPLKAESIYKQGYGRIAAGEYGWANTRFNEAFATYPKKNWFYRYAEAFRDERQYIEAEKKYQELMYYTASKNKRGIPEKQAVLDYAFLATYYMRDYEKADMLLRRNILDYLIYDKDALLALGDNSLAWGEIEPERLEDAREAYATHLERYGQSDPLLERMLKYFIMTDNLQEVIPLQKYFMATEKRPISAVTLADLGGYLINKRTEEVRGVPNEFIANIGGIRDVLLRAIRTDQRLPESYYHLARYYNEMDSINDEAYTLERALQVFAAANEESPRRLGYNIGAIRRYAEILIHRREFFPAEEQLIKGVNLYENGLDRRLLTPNPDFGRLYADLGDLEYFVKSNDMEAAIDFYLLAEKTGYSPPELRYRIGAAHYQLGNWSEALLRFTDASSDMSFNRRILHALGNVSYMRGNYNAAQAYYDRLLEILDADRARHPPIMPTDNKEQLDLAERLMVAQNNMGVVLDSLASRTGDNRLRSRALGLFAESERAWDIITRNPETMVRMRPSSEINAPGINPAYLNVQNSLHPVATFEPQFFIRIDKDILEPSPWDELAPPAYRLSQGLSTGSY